MHFRSQLNWGTWGILLAVVLGGCADMTTNPLPARRQGMKLFQDGNYAEAAGSFKNAIHQDARDYRSHYYLGVTYQAMKNDRQAIASYKACLDVMTRTIEGREDLPFRAKVRDTLAYCLARYDQRQHEIDLVEASANQTKSADGMLLVAKTYAYGGDADSAITAYECAARLEPMDFYVNKEMGLYLTQIGQTDKASLPLRKAYARNNEDPEVVVALQGIGIVPGPGIIDMAELTNKTRIRSKYPEPDLNKIGLGPKPIGASPAVVQPGPLTGEQPQSIRE